MLDFHEFIMRHGESAVQDLIERMERYENIRGNDYLPLEQRWVAVMELPAPSDDEYSFLAA